MIQILLSFLLLFSPSQQVNSYRTTIHVSNLYLQRVPSKIVFYSDSNPGTKLREYETRGCFNIKLKKGCYKMLIITCDTSTKYFEITKEESLWYFTKNCK